MMIPLISHIGVLVGVVGLLRIRTGMLPSILLMRIFLLRILLVRVWVYVVVVWRIILRRVIHWTSRRRGAY